MSSNAERSEQTKHPHESVETHKPEDNSHHAKLHAEVLNESNKHVEQKRQDAVLHHPIKPADVKAETKHPQSLVFDTKKLYEQKKQKSADQETVSKPVSEQLISATAKKIREDLRADKWIIDPRAGDSKKVEQTLSALPRDRETMQKLQKAYAADKDHPHADLTRDLQSRLSKDDAGRITATIESPQSHLTRLENARTKIVDSKRELSGADLPHQVLQGASLVVPALSLLDKYQQAEAHKHLSAGTRELREQLSVMNSKDIETASKESLLKTGRSLEQHLLETPGLQQSDKSVLHILLKGSDKRAQEPALNTQLAAEAIKTRNIDLLRESLRDEKAREIFNKRKDAEPLHQVFSGNDLKIAEDLTKSGQVELATQVAFNRGLFGTSKEDVAQAIKTMSDEQRASLKRGQEIVAGNSCPAHITDRDKQSMLSFLKFQQSVKDSFNAKDSGDLRAQALYGENNLISKIAKTHSEGIFGIGAAHDQSKIYDLVDSQLSRDDYSRLKNDKEYRQALSSNLKTYLSRDEFERVNTLLDRKLDTKSYEQSKTSGRSVLEKLQDAQESTTDRSARGALLTDLARMSPTERARYKNDIQYRKQFDSEIAKTFGKDDVSAKIAQRLLQNTQVSESQRIGLTAIERVQIGGMLGDNLPKTIDNIEKSLQSDPTLLSRIKNPRDQGDRQTKNILDKELRRAIYRSGEVVTYESGQDNFDSIYTPLSKKLFEQTGKIDLSEKLSHTDRDLDAYKSLASITLQERLALLNDKPESEADKALQANVYGRFSRVEEKQLAKKIIAAGDFSQLEQIRAATISRQSLSPDEIEAVKDTLGKIRLEDRASFNDKYATIYGDNPTSILAKIPREEQASVEALLKSGNQNSGEVVENLSHRRSEAESGLLGGVRFGKSYTANQNADDLQKAYEDASAKHTALSQDKQQHLITNASESYTKWELEKEEKANQITDGAVVGLSIVASGGTSIPVALSVAAGGGALKVAGNKVLIGDNYNKVEQATSDFARGSVNTVVNRLGPDELAGVLHLGESKTAMTAIEVTANTAAKQQAIKEVAKVQGLNVGAAFVGGSASGGIDGLTNWDPALTNDDNIRHIATQASDAGISAAVTAFGITSMLHAGRIGAGKLLKETEPKLRLVPSETGIADHPTKYFHPESPTKIGNSTPSPSSYILSDGSENHLLSPTGKLTIDKSEIIIGRDPASDIIPTDNSNTLSRKHASIVMKGDHAFIKDLGSTNHTFVNGQVIDGERLLKKGDTIRFGHSDAFTFGNDQPPPHIVLDHGGQKYIHSGASLKLGRLDLTNDIALEHPTVSSHHATIRRDGNQYFIKDHSTNGTYVNGDKALLNGEVRINHGDKIRLGGDAHDITFTLKAPELRARLSAGGKNFSFEGAEVTLGRDPSRANLVFGHERTSGRHAIVRETEGKFYLRDAGSTNGTFVNGIKINKEIELKPGVRIQLGPDTEPIVFTLERKELAQAKTEAEILSLEKYRKSSESLPEVNGRISKEAAEQSNRYGSSHEINDRLEDGWTIAGADAKVFEDGRFDSRQKRPAIVVDRQNDPILKATIVEAKRKFEGLPPKKLTEELTIFSRDLFRPGGLSENALDRWYDDFNHQHNGKRIYLGELIRQGKGLCSQQSVLLKVLADEFPQLEGKVTLVRGNSVGSRPGEINHAWAVADFGDGKPLIYDPRQSVYGLTYEQYLHTPGRDLILPAANETGKIGEKELQNGFIRINGRNFDGNTGGKHFGLLQRPGYSDQKIFLQESDTEALAARTRKEIAASKLTADLFDIFPATVQRELVYDGRNVPFRVQANSGRSLQMQFKQSINFGPLNDLASERYGDDANANIVRLLKDDSVIYKAWEKAIVERGIFGDNDLHPGNLTFEKEANGYKISNIDLGGGFGEYSEPFWPNDGPLGFHRRAFAEFASQPLNTDVRIQIEKFVQKYNSNEGRKELRALGLNSEEAESMISRAEWFAQHGTLPPLKKSRY